MDEHDKRRVGEQIEPGGRPKAPGRLELLQRFVNSYNHDFPPEWDRIGTAEKAQAWLRAEAARRARRPASRTPTRPACASSARRSGRSRSPTRERRRTPAAEDDPRGSRARLGSASPSTTRGGPPSSPPRGGVDGAVATLLGILHEAQLTGHWPRLKGCRQCGYAFFDRSKNRSAAWCAMSICGNRTKNRAYYRRRAPGCGMSAADGRAGERGARRRRPRVSASPPSCRSSSARAARAGQPGPGGGLRDHGARPEHRRRLRRAARPRLRGVLRDRRARRRVLRVRVLGQRRRRHRHRAPLGEPAAGMPGIHFNFLIILVLAVVATTIAGVLIGVPTLRLRGDYVGIVTLAFGEIIGQVVANGRDIQLLRRVAHRRAQRDHADRQDRPAVARAASAPLDLRPWYWFALALVGADAARQRPAARLARGPGVDRAARRRGRGGERRRPDRAHEAARLRRGRRAGRGVRRLPRVVPEHGQPRTSSRSRSRSSSSPWSCSAGWARSGASSLGAIVLSGINHYLLPRVLYDVPGQRGAGLRPVRRSHPGSSASCWSSSCCCDREGLLPERRHKA